MEKEEQWKVEYAKAREQKHMCLERLYRMLKSLQVDAVTLRETNEEKFLRDIMNFRFKVVPTVLKKDGTMGIGKWLPYDQWAENGRRDIIDYYTVLPNEIVFESDFTAKQEVEENGKKVLKVLEHETWNDPNKGQKIIAGKLVAAMKKHNIPSLQGFSGGKGPHTHVFFSLPNRERIREFEKKGIRPTDLRRFLFNKICDMAKIPKGYRERGGVVDISCVYWDEGSGAGHLVRCFGGRKFKETISVVNEQERRGYKLQGYKTLLNELPDKKPDVLNFTEVRYPEKFEHWQIPQPLMDMLVNEFKPVSREFSQQTKIELKGMHINLPCMKLARRTRAPDGVRNIIARQQAYACIKDRLSLSKALAVCEEFYANCDKNDFDFSEAKYCFEWAYARNADVYIACPLIKQAGFCNDAIKQRCELYNQKKAEFIKKMKKKKRYGQRQPPQLKPFATAPKEWMRRNWRKRKAESEVDSWVKAKIAGERENENKTI